MTEIIKNAEADIEYLRQKLVGITNIADRQKIEKQIALMEDAVVIYREVRLSEKQ